MAGPLFRVDDRGQGVGTGRAARRSHPSRVFDPRLRALFLYSGRRPPGVARGRSTVVSPHRTRAPALVILLAACGRYRVPKEPTISCRWGPCSRQLFRCYSRSSHRALRWRTLFVTVRFRIPDWGAWTTTDPNHIVVDLSAKTYTDNEENCAVNWVSETPGAGGPIYSAHLQCSRRSDRGGQSFTLDLVIWPKSSDEIAVGPGFMSLKIFHRCRATRPPPTGVARSRAAPLSATDTGAQGECPTDGNT